jgi:hypothetical protein
MKVRTTETLPNGIGFSIVEVDDRQAEMYFDKRFQVVLELNNKRVLPKDKNKFCKFEENAYLYRLKSDRYDGMISLSGIPYHELMICDKTLEECTTELLEYISMYNQGTDLKRELKLKYKF